MSDAPHPRGALAETEHWEAIDQRFDRLERQLAGLTRTVAEMAARNPPTLSSEAMAEAAKEKNRAIMAMRERDGLRAEGAARAAALACPDSVDFQFTLAWVLHETGQLPEAEARYRQALSLAPKHASAWFNLGNVLERLNQTEEASDAWRTAAILGHEGASRKQREAVPTPRAAARAENVSRDRLETPPRANPSRESPERSATPLSVGSGGRASLNLKRLALENALPIAVAALLLLGVIWWAGRGEEPSEPPARPPTASAAPNGTAAQQPARSNPTPTNAPVERMDAAEDDRPAPDSFGSDSPPEASQILDRARRAAARAVQSAPPAAPEETAVALSAPQPVAPSAQSPSLPNPTWAETPEAAPQPTWAETPEAAPQWDEEEVPAFDGPDRPSQQAAAEPIRQSPSRAEAPHSTNETPYPAYPPATGVGRQDGFGASTAESGAQMAAHPGMDRSGVMDPSAPAAPASGATGRPEQPTTTANPAPPNQFREAAAVEETDDPDGGFPRLTIRADPPGSEIQVLNIEPRYQPGMRLRPGRYHIKVAHPGYQTVRQWVRLRQSDLLIPMALEPDLLFHLTVKPTPSNAQVRILNINPRYQPNMGLTPGKYHLDVSAPGYRTVQRWIDLDEDNMVIPIILRRR